MDYGKELLAPTECNEKIKELLLSKEPVFIGRIGDGEMRVIEFYLNGWKYTDDLKYKLENNMGFFPAEDKYIDKMARLYIEGLKKIDLIGVWFNPYEDVVVRKYTKNAIICKLSVLTPFLYENAWSSALKDKKILVIHPFSKSIKMQYQKRDKLFRNPNILPEFELDVLTAVQTIAGNRDKRFKTWFEALEYMKNEIIKKDFDIAIIGAGAYGFPLGAFIKDIGKKAVHMGGSTQLLFGIRGKRWDNREDFRRFFNEYWIRPLEKPKNFEKVEGGCYW
jgi:hypothetical protein